MLEKDLRLILRNLIILFYFLDFSFFDGGKLLYNVVLVSAEQQKVSEP